MEHAPIIGRESASPRGEWWTTICGYIGACGLRRSPWRKRAPTSSKRFL